MDDSPQVPNLSRQAINACLDCKWDDAIRLNRQIIKMRPENVDALNRLAKANMELGKYSAAKKFYTEALKYDPYNPIAGKNLKMIKSFKPDGEIYVSNGHTRISPSLFLQEPGKTKIVSLLKVAEPQKLSKTFCGMSVLAVLKNRKITITDSSDTYLGILPDDMSHSLIRLMHGGNKYEFFIKSVKVNGLSILIRETFRSKKFKNQPSFPEYSDTLKSSEMLSALTSQDTSAEGEEADETETA